MKEQSNFNFWVKYLKFISIFFAALGFMWMLVGSLDPFGIWDKAFAKAFWAKETLPVDAQISILNCQACLCQKRTVGLQCHTYSIFPLVFYRYNFLYS